MQSNPEAAAEQAAALAAYERGTAALDAARRPGDMQAVSRNIAEGQYRLACAEAVANGEPKPGRRPMCFFDPRHGMSVTDVSWAPPDGGPSRLVPVCADGPAQDRAGHPAGDAHGGGHVRLAGRVRQLRLRPGVLGRFRLRRSRRSAASCSARRSPSPPIFINEYGYGDPGYYDGGDNFGGGDFGGDGGDDFGGGDFGGGDFGGGDMGGGDFGGGDFGGGGGDF